LYFRLRKIENMHGSEYSEQCTVSKFKFLADLSFLLRLKYEKFCIDFLHTSRSHNDLYQDLFLDFFETFKCHFEFFKKKTASMELKLHLRFLSLKIMPTRMGSCIDQTHATSILLSTKSVTICSKLYDCFISLALKTRERIR
jgi:hypothetical protein